MAWRFITVFVSWIGTVAAAIWLGGIAATFIAVGLGLIVVQLLFVYAATSRIRHARVVIERQQWTVGEAVAVQVTIELSSRWPLFWLVVEQSWCNQTKGTERLFRQWFIPLFRPTLQTVYRIPNVRRGEYESRPLKLYTGDMFGLIIKQKYIDVPSAFIVTPHVLDIAPQALPLLQPSETWTHIRDYAEGDPFNRIHWKSSARFNALKTKETDRLQRQKMLVLLDAERAAFAQEKPMSSFEKCVQVAASLLRYGQHSGLQTSLVCSDRQGTKVEGALGGGVSFRAARLSAPLGEPIELVLARVRADGETAFHHIVREEARHAAAGTTVFCVTAQLREELFAVIQQLRKQHIPVGFMLVYSSTALSWPQQYLKERLEAIGCSVYTIKHAELEWHGHEVMHDVG